MIQMNLQNRKTHKLRKLTYGCLGKGIVGDTLLYSKRIINKDLLYGENKKPKKRRASGFDPRLRELLGFPGGTSIKNPPANAGAVRHSGSIPGLGRSPGGRPGNPLQYSCL